ncbi:hypothetical protein PMAC_000619 [Pneumocystis sp. 'macacae']|nr:hypothetical protein PMAC_000619 [Pneumocystis sp. 'macacae']
MFEKPTGLGIHTQPSLPPRRLHAEQYLKAFGWKGRGYGLRANSLAVPLQLPSSGKQGSQVEAWWTCLLDTRLSLLEVKTQSEKTAVNASDPISTPQGLYAHFVRANTTK